MSWIEMSPTFRTEKTRGALFCLPWLLLKLFLVFFFNLVSSFGLQRERPEWNCTSNYPEMNLGGAVVLLVPGWCRECSWIPPVSYFEVKDF